MMSNLLQAAVEAGADAAPRAEWADPMFLFFIGVAIAVLAVTVYLIASSGVETEQEER